MSTKHHQTQTQVNQQNANLIKIEVEASFEPQELIDFESFEQFWDEVEIQNGYEEEWEDQKAKWKPFYREYFNSTRRA